MIRRDIIFSDSAGNFHTGHNVKIAGGFAFSDSTTVPAERIVPSINRADMPVFGTPLSGGKKKEYVWVGANDGHLLRVDRESGAVKEIPIGGKLQRVAVDSRFVYVLDFDAGIISRVSKDSLAVASVNVPSSGTNYGLSVDTQDVWYSTGDSTAPFETEFFTRRVPRTAWNEGLPALTEAHYGFPTVIFAEKDYVWVTNTIYLRPLEGAQGQTGASSTTSAIVFDHPDASTVDDFYNGMDLWIYYGGWTGAWEVRTIVDYVGATKTAHVNPPYDDVGGFFADPAFWVWYKVRKYELGRIDKSDLTVTPIQVMRRLTDIATDADYVWACSSSFGVVLRISKADFSITVIDMDDPLFYDPFTLAVDDDFVWTVDNKFGNQGIIRIKKSDLTFQKIDIAEPDFRCWGISIDSKYVWVTGEDSDKLIRMKKADFTQTTITLPGITKCSGHMTDYAYRTLIAA